jgi:hypothetical protein
LLVSVSPSLEDCPTFRTVVEGVVDIVVDIGIRLGMATAGQYRSMLATVRRTDGCTLQCDLRRSDRMQLGTLQEIESDFADMLRSVREDLKARPLI